MSDLRHEQHATTAATPGPAPAQTATPPSTPALVHSGPPTPWEALREQLGRHLVLGEPVQRAGVTLVPVARVRAGAGGGAGGEPGGFGSGGGGGYVARPAGAWVITDAGATWSPAVDVNRIVTGGQLLALGLAAVLVLRPRRVTASRGLRRGPSRAVPATRSARATRAVRSDAQGRRSRR